MAKWFVYIVFSLILIPWLSSAEIHPDSYRDGKNKPVYYEHSILPGSQRRAVADTTIKKQTDDKKKIKEVTKAKHVPKPEKVDDNTQQKPKPKRQRRPPGMERPPEIPRHNGD